MTGVMGSLNHEALQAMFMASLDHLWKQWSEGQNRAEKLATRPIATPKRRGRARKTDTKQFSIQPFVDEAAIPKFIAQLPQAEITSCSSLVAVAPIQEKGRKRLREFKDSVQHGRAQKKTKEIVGKENEPVQAEAQQPKITEFASVRKTNLLDRILAKQTAAAFGPAAPTSVELQRKAALQRSEDVLGLISLLCASKPGMRASFSMATLVQSLQGSIRSPISKDEALKCIEVLANEVTPGYISIVRMGAISSVVVNQAMRPVDVKGRLAALGAA